MYFRDFAPDALAGDGPLDRAFLEDLLKQFERHREWLVDAALRDCESELRTYEDLKRGLTQSKEHYVGWQSWSTNGELQSRGQGDRILIPLAYVEQTIRHIRNFLYPEEVQQIEAENARRRAEFQEKRKFPSPVVSERRPKKKAMLPKSKGLTAKTKKGKK